MGDQFRALFTLRSTFPLFEKNCFTDASLMVVGIIHVGFLRHLETLKLKVDFRTMVTPSLSFSGGNDVGTGAAPDETRGRACKLRKLVVGSSILPNPPESGWIVAIGLGKIFPFLTEVEGFGRGRSNCKWEQVGGYIRMSRQVLRIVGNSGA